MQANIAQNQTCLICNKDDLAVKTLTKMTIYTDVFAQVIFGAFLSFM